MRIVLRDCLTNDLIVELFDKVNEDLSEKEIQDIINSSLGLDEETSNLLENEKYYISYEESE